MRQVTLAAATLAAFSFAMLSTAQADSNYGPTKNGDQCWRQQSGNSLGYWTKCAESRSAQATRTSTRNSRNATATQR
jgi:hypothetical protein